MARTKISEFSATPANNTDIDSINISEGCPPSSINDAIRELMSQLKDFQTGAVGDSFNGPIGSSTASTGAFTTLSATGAITSTLATGTAPLVIASTTKVANLNVDLLDGADWAAPAALGSTTPAAGAFTTLSASSTVTLSGGTANGVAYLNGSKVVTSGSALTFDGTNFSLPTLVTSGNANIGANLYLTANALYYHAKTTGGTNVRMLGINAGNTAYVGPIDSGPNDTILNASASSANIQFYATGSEAMRLTSTGLGIGTSSPATALHVSSGNFRLTNGAAFTTADSLIREINAASGSANQYVTASIGFRTGNFSDAGAITFGTANNASTPTERMRLDQVGNLGIGTSSPVSPLTVAGTASVNWVGGASSTGTATIGTQGTGGSLLVQTPSVNASYASGFGVDGTYSDGKSVINLKALGTSSGGPYSADMAFFTSTNTTLSEKMRLDSSGNLGLGVTPSADWASSGYKAAVVRSAFLAGGSGVGVAVLGNNAYNDGGGWRYVATGVASYYVQNAGAHSWSYAASGTAGNAITFSQAMTLTANGELMVGTTTATGKASIAGAITATASSALVNPSVGVFGLYTGGAIPNTYVQMPSGGSIDFWKADTGVAARIDSSGNLLVGTTSAQTGVASDAVGITLYGQTATGVGVFTRASSYPLYVNNKAANGGLIQFYNNGNSVGTITSDGTSAAYNTSSDYRLKNTIAPMTGALAKVALLKPCTYKWNADGSDGEGFIAHELAEVVPQCVTGQKDAVDEEGNPKYQGIDTSFLVATLTAALQELNAKFDAYVASHP